MAFGLNYFTIANQLAEGGFTGVAILLSYAFGVSPSLGYLLMNVPLFFAGWRALGARSMGYTMVAVLGVSGFLKLTEGYAQPLQGDLLLAALYAGVTVGAGLGIIFRFGGTSGGSAILARMAEQRFGWSIGRSLFAFDVLVILASATLIGRERALYTLVALFLGSRVIDYVQEASYGAKAAIIVSAHAKRISQAIHEEMGRGTTLLRAVGGFTRREQDVVYCVVARQEISRLKQIVERFDSNCFMVISDAHHVIGEGFSYKRLPEQLGLAEQQAP
jgi:uncharacterized membrane-anchored protein YitT (DUF2179 family)